METVCWLNDSVHGSVSYIMKHRAPFPKHPVFCDRIRYVDIISIFRTAYQNMELMLSLDDITFPACPLKY